MIGLLYTDHELWQMLVSILKPDALHGRYAQVTSSCASDLFIALAAHLSTSTDGLTSRTARVIDQAVQQINERARNEPAFAGNIRHRRACIMRLNAAAKQVGLLDVVSTPDVIAGTLEALGFQIINVANHRCNDEDVQQIYRSAIAHDHDLHMKLRKYLVAKSIRVLWLRGDQHPCVLQHWKTFVRHIIQNRRKNQYRLRNLIHVCDGFDQFYLTQQLFSECSNNQAEFKFNSLLCARTFL